MENTPEAINNLILDLSLASTLPSGVEGRDFIRATASTNALVSRTKQMQPRELRELEYSIGPLLVLLMTDIENPVAAKAALGIRSLMPSRICMSQLVQQDGLVCMSRVLDELLGRNMCDLKTPSLQREIVEHLSGCYREIGRFYPWEIVKVGALRHCVLLLRFGDEQLQTTAAGTLATLSTDLDICKQMFVNGAIRPLLNVSDGDVTNAACMLAGLGCIVQLCNIPEIGAKVVSQGAMALLGKALHRKTGHSVKAIREKALYAIAWLSRIEEVRGQLGTNDVLKGMKRELKSGTMPSRYTVIQVLLNIHGRYEAESRFMGRIIDHVLHLLKVGPWHARNLCVKAVCVLYPDDGDKMYLVQHGVMECVFALIDSKPTDLQEAPLVCFLSLCTNRDIPFIFIEKGGVEIVAGILERAADEIIRELAIVLLKVIALYDVNIVEQSVSPEKAYLLQRDDIPNIYGSEYGELIEDYLQRIVENRRDMHYLLEQLNAPELEALNLTEEELQSYQNTFMELDMNCIGTLGIDELKMLVVMMGEELDRDELKDLFDEYGTHKSGALNFYEFIHMMQNWNTRFGTGATKAYNVATKRGAIGRARRELKVWLNKNEIEKAQIEEIKAKKKAEVEHLAELSLQYQAHERLALDRENEVKLRSRMRRKNSTSSYTS